MVEVFKNKFLVGTIIVCALFFYFGGVITRNIDYTNTIPETTSSNM